jgi:hypothetical protein
METLKAWFGKGVELVKEYPVIAAAIVVALVVLLFVF